MAIKVSDKIVKQQVKSKFLQLINNITIRYQYDGQKKGKYLITNTKSDYTSREVSSSISTKASIYQNIKLILDDMVSSKIDDKELLDTIQLAMRHLSRARNTVYTRYQGDNMKTQHKANTWSLLDTETAIGAFSNIITSETFTSDAAAALKNEILAGKTIQAADVLAYFNELQTRYANWRSNYTAQYINLYYCHTNCHVSCHCRSRR